MWLPAERLSLTRAQRRQLTQIMRDPLTPKRLALRARIVLGAGGGASNSQLAQELSVSRPTVIHWRKRFVEAGVAGLARDPELGAIRPRRAESGPPQAQPARAEQSKLLDIAGIYVYPPDQAVAFSVEWKDSREAAELLPGPAAGKTNDYIRHGAATLFAALGILAEKAAGALPAGSQAGLWLEFLESLERTLPRADEIHLIVGPGGSHEDARIEAWFARHARFHVHCTPSGGSWISLTRRWWFAEIKREQMRLRALGRVADLVRAVDGHILGHHGPARPFVWTAAIPAEPVTGG